LVKGVRKIKETDPSDRLIYFSVAALILTGALL